MCSPVLRLGWLLVLTAVPLAAQPPARAAHPAAGAPAISVIHGTVTGRDGRPLPLAHVELWGTDHQTVSTTRADSAGAFVLAHDRTGPLWLEFRGLHHARHRLPLYLSAPSAVALDVRLARPALLDTLRAVRVTGDFNRFARDSTAVPLARQPDGSWAGEIAVGAPGLVYQLLGVLRSGPIAGTHAERFAYHEERGYVAAVRVHDGKARIVFDPRRLAGDTGRAEVRFRDSTGRVARSAAVLAAIAKRTTRMREGFQGPASDTPIPGHPWDAEAKALQQRIDAERDDGVRRLLLVELMQVARAGGRVGARYGEQAQRELPPGAPEWTLMDAARLALVLRPTFVVARATDAADPPRFRTSAALRERVRAAADAALAAQRDEELRVSVLGHLAIMLIDAGERVPADVYLARLGAEHPDHPDTRIMQAMYSPGRALQVGKPMPAFRFAALGDSARVFTPETLKGQTYLLDFWATWCAPCIAEMPVLHAAHAKYRAKGFEILSVSADEAPDEVRRFRAGRWAMPWQHAFVSGGLRSPELRPLEVSFVPRAVLVDGTGTILAVDDDLRREKLEQTLAKVLP